MSYTDYVIGILDRAVASCMTMPEFVDMQIKEWEISDKYIAMLDAESYYRNRSSIQGKTNRLRNNSNVKLEHPILRKLVDQKVNYLLSNSWSISSENKKYGELLTEIFDDTARYEMKGWGKEAIKKGIAWVQVCFDEGRFRLKRCKSEQIIPCWLDEEHTRLDGVIKYYPQIVYEGRLKKTIIRVEFWSREGVSYFVKRDGVMTYDTEREDGCHFCYGKEMRNWQQPPFIFLRYNEEELPLLHFIKELIDDINWQESITADVLRDIVNFIYVIKNYGGTDLDEFIKELRNSKAIKVEGDGGVDKLSADLDINAVMQLLNKHRKDIYDYARSVDTQDPELGNVSGLALRFRYSDLDLDMNDFEAELQYAFDRIKPFVDEFLKLNNKGSFYEQSFNVAFKRDVIVNETEIIENINKSTDLSLETRLARHPWIEDVEDELEKISKEKEENMLEFGGLSIDENKQGILDGKSETKGN